MAAIAIGVFSSFMAVLGGSQGPPQPRRVVAVGPNSAEIICELGACDRIVGASRFCVYPAELKNRPQVGGLYDADLERIAALRPDLLVTRGRHDAIDNLCRELGIAIYEDTTDSIAGMERTIRDLGRILGLERRASELIAEFRGRLDSVRGRVAGRPRPRVFLTVSRQPDRLANVLTTGRGTFLAEMIEIAGGVNVFGDLDMRYPEVSPEGILSRQPDVIIEFMPEVVLTAELEQNMRDQWRELFELPATANQRIFFLDEENCLIPSPRYTAIVDKVSRLLHPD